MSAPIVDITRVTKAAEDALAKVHEQLGGMIGGFDGKPILPLAKPSTGNRHQRRASAAAAGKVQR